jgi:hypothetical protein
MNLERKKMSSAGSEAQSFALQFNEPRARYEM